MAIKGEGQLHIKHDNIADFDKYKLVDVRLKDLIMLAKDRGL